MRPSPTGRPSRRSKSAPPKGLRSTTIARRASPGDLPAELLPRPGEVAPEEPGEDAEARRDLAAVMQGGASPILERFAGMNPELSRPELLGLFLLWNARRGYLRPCKAGREQAGGAQ